MKKLITAVAALALVLAMSVTAFASDTAINQDSSEKTGDTTIHFSVAPAYTVTIPADVTLALDNGAYTGSGEITTGVIRLGSGQTVDVKIAGDFVLESKEGATLAYTVKLDGQDTALKNNDIVAKFGTKTTAQSVKLSYRAANPEFAGIYRDTLTFTISAPAAAGAEENN